MDRELNGRGPEKPIDWSIERSRTGAGKYNHWAEYRTRPPEWFEAEAQHRTRFGQYWVGGTGGDARVWKSRYAFPPHVGPAVPGQWPQTQPVETPPFVLRAFQELASPALRITDSRRIRDHIAHIRERAQHSGSAFQDAKPPSAAFARGIRWAELASIELYRKHDQLRWVMDGINNDHNYDPRQSKDYEEKKPKGWDSEIAEFAGFEFQEVENTMIRRRRKYGKRLRERQKAGRKPLGAVAMTNAERQRRFRQKLEKPATNGAVLPFRRRELLSTTALTKPYFSMRDVPLSTLPLRPGPVPPTLAPAAPFDKAA